MLDQEKRWQGENSLTLGDQQDLREGEVDQAQPSTRITVSRCPTTSDITQEETLPLAVDAHGHK